MVVCSTFKMAYLLSDKAFDLLLAVLVWTTPDTIYEEVTSEIKVLDRLVREIGNDELCSSFDAFKTKAKVHGVGACEKELKKLITLVSS